MKILIKKLFPLAVLVWLAVNFFNISAASDGPNNPCLADLEKQMLEVPQVLIAAADLEEKMNRLDHVQARSGLSFRANLGISQNQELEGLDSTRNYSEFLVGGRLRYPLLGLYEKNKIDIAKAEARVWESQHRMDMAQRQGVKTLRNHYIDYWAAREKDLLSQAFLQQEDQVEKVLEARVKKGLLLEADQQEFLTAFAMVRRNMKRMEAVQKRSLRVLNLLTRSRLDVFTPQIPLLPETCGDLTKINVIVLETHPEIRLYRSLVDEQLGILEMTRLGDWDGWVDLGGFVSKEDAASEDEYGMALNLTVSLPTDIARSNRAGKKVAAASLKKAQLQLDLQTSLILADAESAWEQLDSENANLSSARQRVSAALEMVRKELLRIEKMPGDTLALMEQARYQYYLAAMDLVEAQRTLFLSQANLLQYIPENCNGIGTANQTPQSNFDSIINDNYLNPLWLQELPKMVKQPYKTQWKSMEKQGNRLFGTYVWASHLLPFDSPGDTKFWENLAAERIDRILVSFDGSQLAQLKISRIKNQLVLFLETARSNKIQVDLLLGEPLWILPEHRQDLMAVIQQLADLDFTTLHLDLEPNQLDETKYKESYLLSQLIRTLQGAKLLSPWPVGLSIHPRYLDPGKTPIPLGHALVNMELDELTLMIYVSRPEKAGQIALSVIERYPGLRVSIAQSVEPGLAEEESYAMQGKYAFKQKMEKLKQAIGPENFNGILIQSYSDYRGMKP